MVKFRAAVSLRPFNQFVQRHVIGQRNIFQRGLDNHPPRLGIRQPHVDGQSDPSAPNHRAVNQPRPVRRKNHEHLRVAPGRETVEFRQELLDDANLLVAPLAKDALAFVKEYYALFVPVRLLE